jgi:phosphatidylserine/phosphatidylglycerophosphate/cardiolipin synthase-like enzyme
VGIDQRNTTREGLQALLNCANQVYVYHDANRRRTFHPKLYIFERRNRYAEVVVGSSNLTESGLFSNYEFNVITRLDLRNPKQRELFKDYDTVFEQFLATPECCKRLDAVLLAELDSRGMLGSERGPRVKKCHIKKGGSGQKEGQ